MKILTILTFYRPHWTGLTAHAARVAEGLAARGHDVTVLTTRHSTALPSDEILAGVRVVRLKPVARVSRGMITPAFPLAVTQLARQADVVQMHTPLPEAPLVGLICRALGKPLLMTHHGDIVMPAGPANRAIERIAGLVLRFAAGLADGVTSYSRDYAQHSTLLRAVGRLDLTAADGPADGKLSYIFPPVDLPPPDPNAVAAWRQRLGFERRVLIGFAGRWVHEKGFDYLLEAFTTIQAEFPDAQLVFAGERRIAYERFYESCASLVEQVGDRLTFLGLLRDPQEIANFYAMCDLFVLPSRTDMLAIVQVEAMLSGTPVVASDIPGARVVVRETGFGLLAPPRDAAALAATIVSALRERASLLPERSVVEQLFGVDRALANYERLLDRLIHRRGQLPSPPRDEPRAVERCGAA